MNIKNILVPTDFSDCSKAAISFAIELALKLKAKIYLMHSMTSTFSATLERLLEETVIENQFKDIEAKTISEIGDPGPAILKQTKKVEADLVVMGSKGSTGGRKFLGSTTTEVISKSEIPVLAIPQKSNYSDFEDIVFMTDFNEGDLLALEEISDWGKTFNADLHILHLFTDDSLQEIIKFRGFKEITKERLGYKKITFERVFNPSFEDGFFNYISTRNPRLIALTRYKKSFLQNLIGPDHARKIEHETTIPLLSLPADKYVETNQEIRTIKQ